MIATELFHPMLVHFPIVLLALLALADVVALARGVPLSGTGTYASMSVSIAALAGLSAIVTWVAGDAAMDIALGRGIAESVIETHEGLGTATAIATVVWALVRGFVWWRGFALERAAGAGRRHRRSRAFRAGDRHRLGRRRVGLRARRQRHGRAGRGGAASHLGRCRTGDRAKALKQASGPPPRCW